MVDTTQVRRALRQFRTDRARLTPEQLAERSGVNRATVYRIEDINTDYTPRIETISALAEAMGLSITGLFLEIESLTHHAPPGESLQLPPSTTETVVLELWREIVGETWQQHARDTLQLIGRNSRLEVLPGLSVPVSETPEEKERTARGKQ